NFLDNTDAQDLDLSDNVLSLSNDATTVDLSGYLDNTDAQTLILTNTDLSISGGNSIDLSSLRDGIGTDNQTLDLQTNALSITNGNTIDLSRYVNTDSQNLTGATLNESNLTIEIENGNSVTVNLNPIVASLENELVNTQQEVEDLIVENTTQQTIINELIARIEALEQNTTGIQDPTTRSNIPILYQNIPNPFNETSTIRYYLPEGTLDASMIFSTMTGQVFSKVALTQTGEGELNITSSGLAQGTYFFTLYVGRTKIDTKKMVIK
ncbi:T9SS type A sorting domain-containing protein, partial [Aquimarina aggregata]|uniref:T9SS type A sorting domain-containing protein n=1 Tax=Aquimarina aggregata TaxID=1642818 RepID=UPI000A5A7F11